MSLREPLSAVLVAPSADNLWQLRGELLAAGLSKDSRVLPLLDSFHDFVDGLATGTSSRDYSHLASKMDISAIGGVVLEQILETDEPAKLASQLFSGLITEGLMVLATRQHVKAWEGELASVYRAAAWNLFDELWRWTSDQNPDLPPEDRRALIDQLLAPVRDPETAGAVKAVLLGRLFQVLLVAYVSGELEK